MRCEKLRGKWAKLWPIWGLIWPKFGQFSMQNYLWAISEYYTNQILYFVKLQIPFIITPWKNILRTFINCITARFTSFAQFTFEHDFGLLSKFFEHFLSFCYYEIEHLSKKTCSNTIWANFVLKWTELTCSKKF